MAIRKQDRTNLSGQKQSKGCAVKSPPSKREYEELSAPMKNITVPVYLADQSRLGQSGHTKAESSDNQRKIFWHSNSTRNHFTTP